MIGPAAREAQIERAGTALHRDFGITRGASRREHVVRGAGADGHWIGNDLVAFQRKRGGCRRHRSGVIADDIGDQMRLRERIHAQFVCRSALIEFHHRVIADDASGGVVDRRGLRLGSEKRKRSDIARRAWSDDCEVDCRRCKRTRSANAAAIIGRTALECGRD